MDWALQFKDKIIESMYARSGIATVVQRTGKQHEKIDIAILRGTAAGLRTVKDNATETRTKGVLQNRLDPL